MRSVSTRQSQCNRKTLDGVLLLTIGCVMDKRVASLSAVNVARREFDVD